MELMTYADNPGPLTQLRKQFQEFGYRKQEREITCALNRVEASRDSFPERWFRSIVFEWTCRYGLSPWRPLGIILWLWALFSAAYVLFMYSPSPSGIYFVSTHWNRGKSNSQGVRIRGKRTKATKWWKAPWVWLEHNMHVLRTAAFFSLISAFDIGFREINVGRWLQMMTKREYRLKPAGWVRTISASQSILSVLMVALWLLTYFGRPFG